MSGRKRKRNPGGPSFLTPSLSRRDVLKLASVPVAAGLFARQSRALSRSKRKVIIAGAGIGGLCCAYELMRRGHEVSVLEAAGRPGGHVFTIRDGLADGLYADAGAEHFTKPGYDLYWHYVKEFNLPVLYYPRRENVIRFIGGKMFTEDMLADRNVLKQFGLNQREIEFLVRHRWWQFRTLYFAPYLGSFEDEYEPFDAGLNHLDQITVTEFLKHEGASAAAIDFIGGTGSALQALWHAAILKLRGVPLWPPKLYRIKGGNQILTDTFASKLGVRLQLGNPVTAIEQWDTGVRVEYRMSGKTKKMEADYLVCALSAVMLRRLRVTPDWPERKAYAIRHVPYYSHSRVIFQARTPFWEKDGVSPNMEFSQPTLTHVWRMAEEVETTRAVLVGTGVGSASPEDALATFHSLYPGTSEEIEQVRVVSWPRDPWASACERVYYGPGQLAKFWPTLIEPHGRVHFVGAYADNLNWGMEAATRSANRVAEAIDKT